MREQSTGDEEMSKSKIQIMDDHIKDLNIKLIQKDKEIARLKEQHKFNNEIIQTQYSTIDNYQKSVDTLFKTIENLRKAYIE